jgi:thymidylate kinase
MPVTVAFDGLNRCGKGTQAALLQSRLREMDVFSVIIRGDGSRDGLGLTPGDPEDLWWQGFKSCLKGSEGTTRWFDKWNEAACRLAHELICWQGITFPQMLKDSGRKSGVLLIDRSIISRIMVMRQAGEYNGLNSLYTVGGEPQDIDWEEVLPTVLFNFHVPQEVLLARLDHDDPKYQFRKGIIEQHFQLHVSVSRELPEEILGRTIPLNGDNELEVIHEEISAVVEPLLH